MNKDEKRELRRKRLMENKAYQTMNSLTRYMDRYYLDALIGIIPGWGDAIALLIVVPFKSCSSMGAWPAMFDCPKQRKIQKFWSCACNCNDAITVIKEIIIRFIAILFSLVLPRECLWVVERIRTQVLV